MAARKLQTLMKLPILLMTDKIETDTNSLPYVNSNLHSIANLHLYESA